MPLTLLLDLDDTLLENSAETFLPVYIRTLSEYLSPHARPDKVAAQLMFASQAMIENQDPSRTLEQTFDEQFYPPLGLRKEDLREVIDNFYREVYPRLEILTKPRQESRLLVNTALNAGAQVVIATNPVFPRTAIEQRIRWAGLDPSKFALITSFENFHFAKPNTTYYAELLGQLGWHPEPILMVGNSIDDDIKPAAALGIPSALIQDKREHSLDNTRLFSDVYARLKAPEKMSKISSLTPSAHCSILRSTPAVIATLAQSSELPNYRPALAEWSVVEIIAHLADLDSEVFLPRMQKIVSEDEPFLPGIQTDDWVNVRKYNSLSLTEVCNKFYAARKSLLSFLEELPSDYWKRPARHAIFGPTTLHEQVAFTCQHDQTHVQQLQNTLRHIIS